jgi:hypothetical protein
MLRTDQKKDRNSKFTGIATVAALMCCVGTASAALAAEGGDQASAPSRSKAAVAAADAANSDTFEFATGVDYSTGHYGASQDTSVVSIPIDAKAQLGRLRLQGTLPYVFVKGPGQLVDGVAVSNPGGSTATTRRSGIGDLTLSAAYLMIRENGLLPSIELGGAVKLPTAKVSIGTRKADFAATASIYKSLSSTVVLFGSAGYSWLGSPSAYRLKSGVTASAGLNYRPVASQNYGVSVAYRQPIADGLKGQAVVSPYMTYRVSKLLGLTLYGVAGLNDASPRLGGGVRLSVFR